MLISFLKTRCNRLHKTIYTRSPDVKRSRRKAVKSENLSGKKMMISIESKLDDNIINITVGDMERYTSVFTQEKTSHSQAKLCIPSLSLSVKGLS